MRGWAITVIGIAVMIAGIFVFGRYVLATANWTAIATSLAGLFLVSFGIRSAGVLKMSRSVFVAAGLFLLLLSVYALFRVEGRVSTAPQIAVLAVAGIALVAVGSRRISGAAGPARLR
jgi:hypothetical protein